MTVAALRNNDIALINLLKAHDALDVDVIEGGIDGRSEGYLRAAVTLIGDHGRLMEEENKDHKGANNGNVDSSVKGKEREYAVECAVIFLRGLISSWKSYNQGYVGGTPGV